MQPVDYSIGVLPWVFLGVGLFIGLVVVWRLRSKTAASPSSTDADAELRLADLEAQRDDLFARLAGETAEVLSDGDQRQLEQRAAETLRQIDALGLNTPENKTSSGTKVAARTPQVTGYWSRHPALAGALLGGGIVALVAVLILIAMRDASPDPQQPGPMSSAPASSDGAAPGASQQPPLPPFVASQVEGMRGTLESNPDDLATRRELALMLLSADRPFDAFQEANTILNQAPDDPEALYITGFVRYLMGQPSEAIAQFDRAIANSPSYSQAWLVKGLIQLQVGERQQAIGTWEAGLVAAGGSEPRLEHLIAQAKTDKSVEEILANPPG